MKKRIQSVLRLWAFGLVAAASSSTNAIDLDSLLIESVGGPTAVDSIRAMRSFQITGTATLNALEGTFTEVFAAPDNFYLEMNFGPFSVAQAYNGSTARQRDHTGGISTLTGYERNGLLNTIYLESFAFLFDDRLPGEAEYLGLLEGPDGGTYHGIRFIVDKVDTMTAYLDTVDALRRFLETKIDNDEVLTTLSDYRDVHGVMMPFLSKSEAPAIPMTSEIRIEWFNPGVVVTPQLFALVDTREAFRLPGDVDSMVIPIEYVDGHIRIVASVNGGTRAYFILDTGSSATILNRSFADALGMQEAGELQARGMGGYESVTLYSTDSVNIGGLVLFDLVVGSLDLSALAGGTDSLPFGGIIGYDFMSRFPMLLDYQMQTVTVYSPSDFVPDTGGIARDIRLTLLAPTVEATVEGIPGDFIIDLGNSLGLILHRNFVDQNDLDTLLGELLPAAKLIGGIGGGVGGHVGVVDSLRMGDIRIDSLQVLLPDTAGGLAGSEELAGNIGNRVLENFRLLFDYAGGRLVFYPAGGNP